METMWQGRKYAINYLGIDFCIFGACHNLPDILCLLKRIFTCASEDPLCAL